MNFPNIIQKKSEETKMAESLARVHTHTHTHTGNLIEIKNKANKVSLYINVYKTDQLII